MTKDSFSPEASLPNKTCGIGGGFNYCLWAKLLVAIPALPIIAAVAASFVNGPLLQVIVGVGAAALAVWIALKIDRARSLKRMVRTKE